METFTIDGTFFESLKKGTILFVDRKDFEQAKRYRSAWVDCREVCDGLMSDLRSWAMDDMVEAVLPAPKLEVRVRYNEDLIQGERGAKFGPCARYSCQRPLAGWYNNRSGKYVCARCAAEQNANQFGRDFAQVHGHPKYTPGGPARPLF